MAETIVLAPATRSAKSFTPDLTFALSDNLAAQAAFKTAAPYQLWVYLKVPPMSAGHLACFCDRSFDGGVTWHVVHHFTALAEDAVRPLEPGGPAGVPGVMGPWDGKACLMKVVCATSVTADIGVAYQIVEPH